MPYKNLNELLIAATQYPAAIEAALPEGAPKLSVMMADAAASFPAGPDLPIELPDLPPPPALPTVPAMGAPPVELRAARISPPPTTVTIPATPRGRYKEPAFLF